MKLSMEEIKIDNSLVPYMEELELVDDLSAGEAVGMICGVAIVGGGVAGIIAGAVKITAVVGAAT